MVEGGDSQTGLVRRQPSEKSNWLSGRRRPSFTHQHYAVPNAQQPSPQASRFAIAFQDTSHDRAVVLGAEMRILAKDVDK